MLGRQKIALDQAGFNQGLDTFLRKAGIPLVLIVDLEAGPEVEALFKAPTIIRVPLRHPEIWALANGGSSIFFDPDGPEEFVQLDAPHGAANAPRILASVDELDAAAEAAKAPATLGPVQADATASENKSAEETDPNAGPAAQAKQPEAPPQGSPGIDQAPAGPGPDAQSQG